MPTPRTSKHVPNVQRGFGIHPRLPVDDERRTCGTLWPLENDGVTLGPSGRTSKIPGSSLRDGGSSRTEARSFEHPTRSHAFPVEGGRPWERFAQPAYLVWRRAVLERDAYRCQRCGRQCKKHERGLAAHHMKDWGTYPEFRLDLANGITLCRACHMAEH